MVRLPRRLLVRAAAGAGALVLLAAVGLAAWPKFDPAERALAREFAELRAEGVLPLAATKHDADAVASARRELAAWLEDVMRATHGPGATLTQLPGAVHQGRIDVARALVDEHEHLVVAFTALPRDVFDAQPVRRPAGEWTREPQPGGIPATESLAAKRSAVNLLCAKAVLSADEPDGATSAGRWLASALALARVTDDGTAIQAMIRVALESIVHERWTVLRGAEGIDVAALDAPVLAELAHAGRSSRLVEHARFELAEQEAMHRVRMGEACFGGARPSIFCRGDVRVLDRWSTVEYVRGLREIVASPAERHADLLTRLPDGHVAQSMLHALLAHEERFAELP